MRKESLTQDNVDITPEKWKESLDYYRAQREMMIEAARLARDQGVSYRDPPFLVGYSLMGIGRNGEYTFYSSHNIKPDPETEKRCAEDGAMAAALEDGTFLTVALVGVSREIHTGGDNNESHDVLHPCKKCRGMLRKAIQVGVLREDSIICNVNDAERPGQKTPWIIEERTVGELLAMYEEEDKE